MKLSKDNVDAIKSSVLVGIAYGAFWGGIGYAFSEACYAPLFGGIGGFVAGLLIGIATTWDTES